MEAFLKEVIQPLSPATSKLFQPVRLAKKDRLKLRVDKEFFYLKFYALIADVETRASWGAEAFTERFFERKWMKDEWRVGATDISALIIHAVWPKDRLKFYDEETEVQFNFLIARFATQTLTATERAEFKISGNGIKIPASFYDHPNLPLSKYQKVGTITSLHEEGVALFMEQGTGKTPCVIRRVCHEAEEFYAKEGKPYRVLIVVPKNLRLNWEREFERFTTNVGRILVVRGGELKRTKLLIEAFTDITDERWIAVIVSYDTIVNSWQIFQMIHWHLAVLDESHYVKNPSTKRSKTMLKIRDRADQRMCLTGTPITNTISDLWAQLEFLGAGLSGFRSFKNFKNFHIRYNPHVEHRGFKQILGYKNVPFLQERLARLAFMITKKEALPELPSKTYDIYEIEMGDQQLEAYVTLQHQLSIQIEALLERADENPQITVTNILTRLLRLAQITSGFVKTDDEIDLDGSISKRGSIYFFKPNPKLEALITFLKESGEDEKFLVWCCFVPDIEEIHRRLTLENIQHVTFYGKTTDQQKQEAERLFNTDANCKALIGNPISGGQGLNLLGHIPNEVETGKNASRVVYYSQNWSLTSRVQSEDRCHRIGTRTSVQYTDLVVPGSIDQEIRARVVEKRASAEKIQDIRSILDNILHTRLNGK